MSHITQTIPQIAMMAAIELPQSSAEVPEWVHLLPAAKSGEKVATADQRGPYVMGNPDEIIAASFASADALEIDINHATYIAAPQGGRSDAVGWIKEMQVRADGIWGRVQWNAEGQRLVGERAYRKLSPVIIHDAKKNILRIANVSLVNRPNLRGLTALNSENSMTFQARLAEILGLNAAASEDDILAAVQKPAMQSALTEIGLALGVQDGDAPAILAAARARATAQPVELTAMQAELTAMATELTALRTASKRAAAEQVVDQAIAEVRAGVKPQRDRFIAMHMADPAGTEALIAGLPGLGPQSIAPAPTAPSSEIVALNAEQVAVARALGVPEAEFLKTLKAERGQKEI